MRRCLLNLTLVCINLIEGTVCGVWSLVITTPLARSVKLAY